MPFHIKPAQPINSRLLIALAGPQASGKTTSALRLATGITQATGGKICVIDTENKRALQYAKDFKFNYLELDPPFSPERYDQAIQHAEKNGYGEGDVIIIDSMSHEHEGPGGVLDMHESYITDKAGNDWKKRDKYNMLGWNHAKKGRKRLIAYTLQRTPCNIILCFRAKEKVEQVKVNGKTQYKNSGLTPIGAEEYFYEMGITMVLPQGGCGKPDWDAQSARINEYGNGPLRQLLTSAGQISENVGQGLAKLSVVTEKPVEETPETKTKKIAKEILSKFNTIEDAGALQIFIEDSEEDLHFIQSNSQATYDHVLKEYESRRIALGG